MWAPSTSASVMSMILVAQLCDIEIFMDSPVEGVMWP